jgi:hypothetical protein
MALFLKLDKAQYGPDGLVTLTRGDDWSLAAKLIDLIGSYESAVDASQYAATGFFPSASGGPDLPCAAVTGQCGSLSVSMPAASTPFVELNSGGEGPYVVLMDNQGKLQTVRTVDQAVVVVDRGPSLG